ncbi:MAG TPA: glycosyltransferase family 2 protein [Saprospiraceae bacterium]|nr:glycosyltransferase family 2 protein [Saprospiraceae bacterium]
MSIVVPVNLNISLEIIPTQPLISVLITYYNQIDSIERALKSVLEQDYPNLEIIIGDDFSLEGDLSEVLKNYSDKRIRLVRNPQNLGRRGNYVNLLYKEATGALATILNADDFFAKPDFFTKVVERFHSSKDVVLVFGHTNVFLEFTNEKVGDAIIENLPPMMDGNWLFMKLPQGVVIPHVTSVYNRSTAMALDFYRSQTISEDWESLYRLILGQKVGFIKEVSGFYGRHYQNVSKDINIQSILANTEYITEPYKLALERGEINSKLLNDWKDKMLYRYFVKNYVKISLWNKVQLPEFQEKLKIHHPDVAKKMTFDYRIAIFNLIKNYPRLLRFAFAKYSKQESVIADFIQFSENKARQ